MKTKKESTTPAVCNKYTASLKNSHWSVPTRTAIPKVAQKLALAESMLYS